MRGDSRLAAVSSVVQRDSLSADEPCMLSIPFLIAQMVVPAVAVAVAGVLLVRRSRRTGIIAVGDVARAGVWMVGAAGIATILGALTGTVHAFGVIRVGFLVGVVGVPLVGAVLVGARVTGRVVMTPAALALAFLGCVPAPLGFWMA